MRAGKTLFVTLMSLFSMVACQGRGQFEATEVQEIDAFHGVYLPAGATNPERSEFEELNVEALVSQADLIGYRKMDPETLEMKETWFARIVKTGRNHEFEPLADLNAQAAAKPELRQFQQWFAKGGRLRVITDGNLLKITRIEGNQRTSIVWVRQDKEKFTGRQGKVQESAGQLRELRDAFVKTWSEKQMVLFERVTRKKTEDGQEIVRVETGSKIADETTPAPNPDGSLNKTIINFRRILVKDAKTAVINEKRPATLDFKLMKAINDKPRRLYVTIVYNPDEEAAKTSYATPVEGAIEAEGQGLQMIRLTKDGETIVRRFQPPGVSVEPTTPVELRDDSDDSDEADGNTGEVTPEKPKEKPKTTTPIVIPLISSLLNI